MNSIVNDLRFALQRKALVNVYQLNQNVVYTGYVNIIDELGIVLTTFDDSGIEDGAVYLTFEAIEFVEFDSDDRSERLRPLVQSLMAKSRQILVGRIFSFSLATSGK